MTQEIISFSDFTSTHGNIQFNTEGIRGRYIDYITLNNISLNGNAKVKMTDSATGSVVWESNELTGTFYPRLPLHIFSGQEIYGAYSPVRVNGHLVILISGATPLDGETDAAGQELEGTIAIQDEMPQSVAAETVDSSADVPSQPDAPTVTQGNQSLRVSVSRPYDGGSRITNYVYEWRDHSPQTDWQETSVVSNNFTITDLVNATLYDVRVRAANMRGLGYRSEFVTSNPATVPEQPSAPAYTRSGTNIVLTFTPPDSRGSALTSFTLQYRILQANPPQPDWTDVVLATDATTHTIEDTTAGDVYLVRLVAENAIGTSSNGVIRTVLQA